MRFVPLAADSQNMVSKVMVSKRHHILFSIACQNAEKISMFLLADSRSEKSQISRTSQYIVIFIRYLLDYGGIRPCRGLLVKWISHTALEPRNQRWTVQSQGWSRLLFWPIGVGTGVNFFVQLESEPESESELLPGGGAGEKANWVSPWLLKSQSNYDFCGFLDLLWHGVVDWLH